MPKKRALVWWPILFALYLTAIISAGFLIARWLR